ncbi:DUF4880 domain-containing protein [Pseudomonas matsuisoli]|uniref:Anti-sigma factor FoxR n=1 Tax=Pseudomonas matsuisoli TaxID=1515666 RepID=A0A917V0Q7_9PSED|nr:DUF4880 domain-containing protein [Pseudomonas matsuisoli]GGK04869.1 anti-sigma factor FoxR [Pseudomonas matsuisoli]
MTPDRRVLQEAADWFALFASERHSDADHRAWKVWLDEPAHASAWQKVERISGQMRQLQSTNATASSQTLRGRTNRRQALKTLAVVMGGGALTWQAGADRLWQHWQADAATGVGQVRQIALADGAALWLNSDSAVDLAGPDHIRFLRGEVLAQAGTHGHLHLDCVAARITLSRHGRCSLRETDSGALWLTVFAGDAMLRTFDDRVEHVAAGQTIRFDSNGISARNAADEARRAWATGILLANDRRLGDVLDDLARYRHGYLGYAPAIAEIRVVGAFPLADTDRVLDALAATLPVRIHRTLPWWVTVEAFSA